MPSGTLVLAIFLSQLRLRPSTTDGVAYRTQERTAHCSGGRKSDIRVPARPASGDSLFRVRLPFLTVSSHGRKGARRREGTGPIREAPPSRPDHPPKALPPNTITLRVRISTYEILGSRALSPLHHLPLQHLRMSVLVLRLASSGREMAATAPGITSSYDSVQNRKGRKGAKEPSHWLSLPSERKIFTLKKTSPHHTLW